MKKVIAVICARGGSKGVPQKNIKILLGKPLISYTIKTAKNCNLINRVLVSTDDTKIAGISRRYGAEVPFIRPKYLAKDTTATAPVVEHLVRYLEKTEHYFADIIVLLDATSPLRTVSDIGNCITLLKDSDAVIAVTETHANPYFTLVEYKSKNYIGIVNHLTFYPGRRQDCPKVYWINSAVYAIKKNIFMKTLSFCPKKTLPYIMPNERSFHVDSMYDFRLLEIILKNKNRLSGDY